jgi:deazaflavin-dependent oxidoreductase (nitroreductase family)
MTAEASSSIRLPGTPKPWMNAAMRTMLRTPGVRSLLGRTFGVITVIGAVTGASYTTPVQYVRIDDHFVVLSQRHRRWWRNIRTCPDVTFEIGSRTLTTTATVVDDGDEAQRYITSVMTRVPRVAKFYGIELDDRGRPDPAGVGALAERVAVILILDEVARRRHEGRQESEH